MPAENLTRIEAAERAEILDTHSYSVELDLLRGDEVFGVTTTVRFACSRVGASTFIDAITNKVHSITLNGRSIDPSVASDGIRIALDDLQLENELVVVSDNPYMHTGEGLHRFVDPADGEVYLYSQFEVPDSRRMFAVFEQPDLKATFQFTVMAPAHWKVVSNSPTPAPVERGDGSAIWVFSPTVRLSSYVTALIAGPYSEWRDELISADGRVIPLGVFARTSLAKLPFRKNQRGFQVLRSCVRLPVSIRKI